MTQEETLLQIQQDDQGTLPSRAEKYLLFLSDSLLFGVRAENVVEIITGHTVTRLPLVPQYVLGIINLRGQIIPIVDIRCLLHHGSSPSDCMIILQSDETQVGILVDRVQKMVDIDTDALLPVPPQNAKDLVCGMCSLGTGETMLAFDCAQLLEQA